MSALNQPDQQAPALKNQLFYGDNVEVLRRHIPDASVDLIYLDPPFNSRQDYNVLFAEKDGNRSASQITAFKDTWEWNEEAARSYEEVVEQGRRVAEAMRAFRTVNRPRSPRHDEDQPQHGNQVPDWHLHIFR